MEKWIERKKDTQKERNVNKKHVETKEMTSAGVSFPLEADTHNKTRVE